MSAISYKPITRDDSLIYEDGKIIGNLYRHHDIFNPGTFSFFVHIYKDWRGAHPVPAGSSINATVNLALETHPLFS